MVYLKKKKMPTIGFVQRWCEKGFRSVSVLSCSRRLRELLSAGGGGGPMISHHGAYNRSRLWQLLPALRSALARGEVRGEYGSFGLPFFSSLHLFIHLVLCGQPAFVRKQSGSTSRTIPILISTRDVCGSL